MNIIDLTPDYDATFLACLKDWDPGNKVGRARKRAWYEAMQNHGLRVKLALDDAGRAIGMIQYLPTDYARVEGEGLYFIQCIWVHGYEEGIGNVQGQGVGSALLQAAEADARARGARGIAAWGLPFPHWMPVAWYESHGYVEVDRLTYDVLVWKPFTSEAQAPRWLRPRKTPSPIQGQVTATAFVNRWCPGLAEASEMQHAASEFGDRVVYHEVDTSDPNILREWGIEFALYIDDECINAGMTDYPPPSYEDIKEKIRGKLAGH